MLLRPVEQQRTQLHADFASKGSTRRTDSPTPRYDDSHEPGARHAEQDVAHSVGKGASGSLVAAGSGRSAPGGKQPHQRSPAGSLWLRHLWRSAWRILLTARAPFLGVPRGAGSAGADQHSGGAHHHPTAAMVSRAATRRSTASGVGCGSACSPLDHGACPDAVEGCDQCSRACVKYWACLHGHEEDMGRRTKYSKWKRLQAIT